MEALLLSIFFGMLVSGIIGLVLGSTIKKEGAGFWLGAFLGPVGWIITFLLPRDGAAGHELRETQHAAQPEVSDEPPSERDLSIDAYRICCTGAYATYKIAQLLALPRSNISIGAVGTIVTDRLKIVPASID